VREDEQRGSQDKNTPLSPSFHSVCPAAKEYEKKTCPENKKKRVTAILAMRGLSRREGWAGNSGGWEEEEEEPQGLSLAWRVCLRWPVYVFLLFSVVQIGDSTLSVYSVYLAMRICWYYS